LDNLDENLPGSDRSLPEDINLPFFRQINPWERFVLPSILLILLISGVILSHRFSLSERLPVYLMDRYSKNGNRPPLWLSNWVKWSKLSPIERAFHSINLSLHWLGQGQPSYKTPAERADILAKSLPSAKDAVTELAHEHQSALFAGGTANLKIARRAGFKIIVETVRCRIIKFREYLKQRYN
jgi:hypothetical protein